MQSPLRRHLNRLRSLRNKNLVPAGVAHEIKELSSACATPADTVRGCFKINVKFGAADF